MTAAAVAAGTAGGPADRALLGDSSAARAIHATDWSRTPLGALADWPRHLLAVVRLVVRCPTPMALLWGDRGTLIYNDGCAAILGDRHPSSLGADAAQVWPEAAAFTAAIVADVLGGRSRSHRDQPLQLDREGRRRTCWFDLDCTPVHDDDGRVAGALAVIVEKTDLVDATRQLEQERATFVEMFEQAPSFKAILRGPQHRIERANPRCDAIAGHRLVVGRTIAEALPDAVAQGWVAQLDAVYRSGRAQAGTAARYAMQTEPGGPIVERWLDYVHQPIRGADGEVTGIFVEGIDVTERVNAAAASRAADARNRQILDSATDYAIVAFDLDGRITRWNEGARRVLGWTEAEMLGDDGSRLYTPEDRAAGRIDAEMRAALDGSVGGDERWHLRCSGERFWASGETTPLLGETGEPIGYVKVLRDRTEQHRAAQALRESQQRLERAQAVGGVGTFTVDLASDTVHGTAGFYRIFGLPDLDSIAATEIEALVVAEDGAPRVASAAASRRDRSAALDVEYRIRRRDDGRLRWIARKAEWEIDGSGDRMVGVVQDVTERKAAEQAVRESAEQFRTLAQALPNHVWTATVDGAIDWCNARVYAYSGAAPGALDGASWTTIVHADDAPAAGARWRHSLQTGDLYETEFRIRRADGAQRWHLVRALPLRQADGTIGRWVGTNTDIHERKQLETDTTRDRDRIWNLSQELMLVCDAGGRITAVNPAWTRLLGWQESEIVGRTLDDFLHPEDLAATAAEVGRIGDARQTMSFENRYRARDDSYHVLSWSAVPDRGYIHAVARDVTRERAAEGALRQSQKLETIGQLTGGVAHDFNNVLAIMRTSVDLLRRLDANDPRRHRFIEAISNAVTRATKITSQLLAFARRQALQPEVFDVGRNLEALGDMIGSLTGPRITVDLRVAALACHVDADPSQFDTALVNMAVNARDAMTGDGRLTIAVASADAIPASRGQPAVPGDFVAVSVRDTGSGIAPEHLAHVFEPFFTTKAAGHGTGLGLSQAFGFAKQSGGDIVVDSRVGEGTTFTIYLPSAQRAPRAVEDAAAVAASPDEPAPVGGRILVVEDNHEVATSVERTLEALGYTTLRVASGEQALVELEHGASRFIAVFSDVVMPGMSGVDLGREVRRLHPGLPVVLSSGYSAVLASDTHHGFTLLPKPYALEELARALQGAIAGQRGPRAPQPA